MSYELCEQFGFDTSAIGKRLNLLGLGGPAIPMIAAELQSHVIQPNVDTMIEEFYSALEQTSEFQSMVLDEGQINHLKMTQRTGTTNDIAKRGHTTGVNQKGPRT